MRAHGAVAGHRREELVPARGDDFRGRVFAQLFEKLPQQLRHGGVREQHRHRAHGKLLRAGGRDLEAHAREDLGAFLGGGHVLRADREHRRDQQSLNRGATVEHGLELLVQDALVRRVHVDEHEPLGVLREDVDAVELAERVAERGGIVGVLR